MDEIKIYGEEMRHYEHMEITKETDKLSKKRQLRTIIINNLNYTRDHQNLNIVLKGTNEKREMGSGW